METRDYARRYGILLPHFGVNASPDKIRNGALLAERLGFDSVWVRDHVIFRPHGMEGTDRTHVEPLTILATVGAITSKLMLGTASLIPYHHPIYLANQLAALSWFVGDRIIIGFGIGYRESEFAAMGLGGIPRADLLPEQVEIMRMLWKGEEISYEGKYYQFAGIDSHPSPGAYIPIWYCGNSLAATRRAVEYCDGFMPGRLNLPTYAHRWKRMKRLADEAGKPVPTAGIVPITSPGRTKEEGLGKVNVEGLLHDANEMAGQWVTPPSGRFETWQDLEGALMAGTGTDIAEEVEKLHAIGVNHVCFDCRFRFDEWEDCVQMIGEEVLPLLRKGAPVAA